MTSFRYTETGVDVVYEGTEFHLDKPLIEEATQTRYLDVTDHEIRKLVEPDPELTGEPRRVEDLL